MAENSIQKKFLLTFGMKASINRKLNRYNRLQITAKMLMVSGGLATGTIEVRLPHSSVQPQIFPFWINKSSLRRPSPKSASTLSKVSLGSASALILKTHPNTQTNTGK